jgi:hypothetical protein
MNGGAESIGQSQTHEGRHRRSGAGGWTPAMPSQPVRHGGRRHQLNEGPVDPPATGSLPVLPRPAAPLPATDRAAENRNMPGQGDPRNASAERTISRGQRSGQDQREPGSAKNPGHAIAFARSQTSTETTSEFPSANGELPVSRPPSGARTPAENGVGNNDDRSGDPTLRRTKVTLTPRPVRRAEAEHEDDVRVYLAPVAGLGTFDLGSVPASVTPPKTWKKAAWFAALSSGGVVVALLIAGSVLVGPPSMDPTSQGWPGYRGGQPLLNGEQQAGTTSPDKGGVTGKPAGGARSTGPTNVASRSSNDASTAGPPRTTAAAIAGTPGSTGVLTTTEPAPSTSSTVPQKPSATPAPRATTPAPWYSFPPDARAMGDNTEKFFNTVRQDPNAASAVTTGKLHDAGPQALAQRYAHVAYFVVKDISIDQGRGVTVNTVEVVHDDGTKTIEQRTLTFADNNKIQSDGQ